MKKSYMTCANCIIGNSVNGKVECKLLPAPVTKDPSDWCGSGKWAKYLPHYDEVATYFWGEWEHGDWNLNKDLSKVA